ncbi:MAG TPA: septum formation initiator family protein [Acidimicrobiales bacterium]|jgi:cell division protein FtsB|nr:septum formation initiator family protein [Acidimicrobiales bacterium]
MAPRGKIKARRRAVAGLVVTVLLVAVLLFAVFPTRSWLAQRKETSAAQQELADIQAKRATTKAMQDKLETDEYIEQKAKEDLGFIHPGEEAYNILPAPTDPIGLPEGWPFTGVERAFGTD